MKFSLTFKLLILSPFVTWFQERGTITISAVEENGFIKISVEDTGIGIPKDVQEKLFSAFTQGGEDIQRQYVGSGLGLYVTQKLLELMNGKIFLQWSELGKGSCFSFILPKSNETLENIKYYTTFNELLWNGTLFVFKEK